MRPAHVGVGGGFLDQRERTGQELTTLYKCRSLRAGRELFAYATRTLVEDHELGGGGRRALSLDLGSAASLKAIKCQNYVEVRPSRSRDHMLGIYPGKVTG